MKKRLLVSLIAGACATVFAASDSFKVTLPKDSVIEGKSFKAGEYKISMENGNALLKQGKTSVEIPAREETRPNKVDSNELTYQDPNKLQEIQRGGSNTAIVFEPAASMNAGQ
jgi:hypothetical protein